MFGGSQSVDKLWFYDKLSSFRFRQVNERQQQLTEDGPRVSRGFHLCGDRFAMKDIWMDMDGYGIFTNYPTEI